MALAFDRMATAALREAGLTLLVTSGFRSDAEQARLFAANPDPRWVAPPGRATEFTSRSSRASRALSQGNSSDWGRRHEVGSSSPACTTPPCRGPEIESYAWGFGRARRRSSSVARRSDQRRTIASMCWTFLTLGLFTGTAVLWRGGSTHNQGLEISGLVLLVAAVAAGAYFG